MDLKLASVIDRAIHFFCSFPRSTIIDIILHPLDLGGYLMKMRAAGRGSGWNWKKLIQFRNNFTTYLYNALIWSFLPLLTPNADFLKFPESGAHQYVKEIYDEEGLPGCYRGVGAKVWEHIVLFSISRPLWYLIREDECGMITEMLFQLIRVVLSHPLRVVMIVSFAEIFQKKNSPMIAVIHEIYQKKGYAGFLVGLGFRIGAEVIFFSGIYIIDKLFDLRQRSAYTTTEAIIMIIRDCFMRALATPLYFGCVQEISDSILD